MEYPTALAGGFEEKSLQIPEELIITPMKEHQRYFPVYDQAGGLLAKFITVRNGDDHCLQVVAAGNEKVLRARLADAEFFWQEDCKIPLADFVTRLETIVFHDKLGSLRAKVERVRKMAGCIGQRLGYSAEQLRKTDRAALLMKGDLVSRAVYEFTELQGIMGEYYARKDGENPEVAQAIREHYQPRFAGDDLPATAVGRVAAIADKLDSIVGFFAVGIQPTGSQDPYALRRAATGVTQIIVRNALPLSVGELIQENYDLLAQEVALSETEVQTQAAVTAFLGQRLENLLAEEGLSYDVIQAVAAAGYDRLDLAYRRAQALAAFRQEAAFQELLAGFTRAANIVRKSGNGAAAVDPALLQEEAEQQLYQTWRQVAVQVEESLQRQDYLQALSQISGLRGAIDRFFQDVMVMAEDEALRGNRLALLAQIVALSQEIGDLSQIVSQ